MGAGQRKLPAIRSVVAHGPFALGTDLIALRIVGDQYQFGYTFGNREARERWAVS